MSTKTIITSLVGVIIVGSIIYFTMKGKDPVAVTTEPVPVQIVKEETPQGETAVVGPTKNASTNEIIDYWQSLSASLLQEKRTAIAI